MDSDAREQFAARMWGYDLAPLTFFRISAVANTMIRTSRVIAASDPECLDLSLSAGGSTLRSTYRTGVARVGTDQLRRPGRWSSAPIGSSSCSGCAGAEGGARRARSADQQLGTAPRIPGGHGLPRAAVGASRMVGGLEDVDRDAGRRPKCGHLRARPRTTGSLCLHRRRA